MHNHTLRIVALGTLGIWVAIEISAGAAAATDSAESHRALNVALNRGLLDLEVRDMPLETVLREVAIEGGFALSIRGRLHDTVSDSFKGLTLVAAIRRLLDKTSYVIEFARSDGTGAASRLRKLLVIERRSPRGGQPVEDGMAKETALIAQRLDEIRDLSRNRPEGATRKLSGLLLNAENPFVREAAANVLARFKGEYVTDALIAALGDKEVSVRRWAIVALGHVREEQAVIPLIDILRFERDEESQVLAAKALGGYHSRETLHALAEASDDPYERVRNAAQSTLTRLERTH